MKKINSIFKSAVYGILVWGIFLFANGCVGTMYKSALYNKQGDNRFLATKSDFALMTFIVMEKTEFILLSPLVLVDLPFSLAYDIITLPIDQVHYSKYRASRDEARRNYEARQKTKQESQPTPEE